MHDAIVYLNGEYMPLAEAKVPVLDRGFIFGDGIYEVIPAYARQLFRLDEHLMRLSVNLDATRIQQPMSLAQWRVVLNEIVQRNQGEDQYVYMQITRGVAKRDHVFPKSTTPTVFIMSSPLVVTDPETFNKGVSAVTMDDIRWQYCNIKVTSLLPNVLLRQNALDQGALEAILVRDGEISEGAASNIFIVADGVIKTPPKSNRLLPGITRDLIVELAQQNGLPCEEVDFSETELYNADEIWMSSSTKEILPIVTLNGKPVANGKPGPITQRMYQIYQDYKSRLKRSED